MLNRSIRAFQGFHISVTLLFWIPIFYAYMKEMGLSDTEYFSIQSYYHWFFIFLEIPTGFIADRWGYRTSLRLGALTMLAANISAIFWIDYTGFFIHFVAIALGRSLMSGASSAYLFDFLKKNDREEEYKKIEGQTRSYALIARMLAWALAGFLYEYHTTLPYWLTAGSCVFALAMTFIMPKTEVKVQRAVTSLRNSFSELFKNHTLQAALFLGVGCFVLVRFTQVIFFQPLLENQGFGPASFGWILALMTVFEASSSSRAHLLEKYFSDRKGMLLATTMMALSLIAVTFSGKVLSVAFLMLFALASGLTVPLIRQQLNIAIRNDEQRATLLSVESIVQRIFMGAASVAAAYFAVDGGMNTFLQSIALLSIIVVSISSYALGVVPKRN